MRKKITRIVAMATCLIMAATTAIFASSMKDVATSHWAYKEITEMQRRGLLVTSSQGEFFPNSYVTYFELSQILAKAAGYQDELINTNIDPTLKKAISDNYTKQKPIIEAHQKNYNHWQKDANEEIAYLLGKGYMKKEDLGKFMSKSTSGVESKRGVRKQEAVVYLVRMLHKEETAKQEYISTGFTDEASIEATYRPYVAYFKKLGIVSGNEKGEFGPTDPITRATLSKMLIETLKIKENPVVPTPPVVEPPTTPTPTPPAVPTDKGLEGKLTKMISKGDNGYYIVLEIEPAKIHTYSIESTASVVDGNGVSLTLASLKAEIEKNSGVNATVKVDLIGTTEYITNVTVAYEADNITPPIKEEKPKVDDTKENTKDNTEDMYSGVLRGNIYSILIAPTPEVTIQLNNGTRRSYKMTSDATMYSKLARRDIDIWDLRLNQQVEIDVFNNKIEALDVTKAAPPMTLTGKIIATSTSGDKIDVRVSYDSITQESNVVRTINIPMITQIVDGTIQRGRKDLAEDMEIVIVYGENEVTVPEQIIILSR